MEFINRKARHRMISLIFSCQKAFTNLLNRMFLSVFIGAFLALHCRHTANEAFSGSDPKTLALATASIDSEGFLRGLNAERSSDASKVAGIILENFIDKMFQDGPDASSDEVRLTRRIFTATSDYLKGSGCDEREKLTFYRGISDQTLFGYQEGGSHGIFLFHGFDDAARKKIKKLNIRDPIGYYGDHFTEAPNFFNALQRQSFQPSGADSFMDWRAISESHHQNLIASPLIDITLNKVIANLHAPSLLKIRICPHRIFPVSSRLYLAKREFYVPFFILPEEIVEVRGVDCLRTLANQQPAILRREAMERCAGSDFPPTGVLFNDKTAQQAEEDVPGNLRLVSADSEKIQSQVLEDLAKNPNDFPLDRTTNEARFLSCFFQSEFNPGSSRDGVQDLDDLMASVRKLWLSNRSSTDISSQFMDAVPNCSLDPDFYFKKLSQDWMINPPEFKILDGEPPKTMN